MFKKLIKTFNTKDIVELEGIETWIVKWYKILGNCSYGKETQCYQAFTNKEDAEKFAKSIEDANKLIGNTFMTHVKVYQQETGM